MNMFSIRGVVASAFVVLVATSGATAGVTAAPGHALLPAYSDANGVFGSFTTEGSLLYVGRDSDRTVVSVAPGGSASTLGSVGTPFTDFSTVFRSSGKTYVSYGTGFSPPYPYQIGEIGAGSLVNPKTINGVYDAARDGLGGTYLAAAPTNGDTQILRYDASDGSTKEVADLGGFSGGLAFDALNNLYYASQSGAGVVRFSAAQLAAAQLTGATPLALADATPVVAGVTASFITLDTTGKLYANVGFPSVLSVYDLGTGNKTEDLASASGGTGIGQIHFLGDTLYANVSDFDAFSGTIFAVVPEPTCATLALVFVGVTLTSRRSRRRSVGSQG